MTALHGYNGAFQPNSGMLACCVNDRRSNSRCVCRTSRSVGNRQQEWPTHPEFWGN